MRSVRTLIIYLELIIIGMFLMFLYQKIYGDNGNRVLGTMAVVPLNKDDYIASPSGNLKYYYEPEPNTRIVEKQISWLSKKVAYTINLDSFNERYDYDFEKPEGVFRIITLGDSHTFGAYVNTPDNWTELLEDQLNNLECTDFESFEVINLGVGGYGPEYIKERYKIRGVKYSPDLIIWNESGGDFDRVNELLLPLIEEAKSKMTEEEMLNNINRSIYTDWWNAVKELNKKYSYDDLTEMVKNSWQEFYKIRGNTKVVVTSHTFLTREQREMLTDWGKGENNVYYYLDLPDTYAEGLHHLDGHPNEAGHEKIAESTLNYLKDNLLQNCGNGG
jgi:lysophospholipase L1-like esterase